MENCSIFHDWLRLIGDSVLLAMLFCTIYMVIIVQKNYQAKIVVQLALLFFVYIVFNTRNYARLNAEGTYGLYGDDLISPVIVYMYDAA